MLAWYRRRIVPLLAAGATIAACSGGTVDNSTTPSSGGAPSVAGAPTAGAASGSGGVLGTSGGTPATGGTPPATGGSAGSATGGAAAGAASGGTPPVTGGSGAGAGNGGASAGLGGAQSGGSAGAPVVPGAFELSALAAHTSVGLEWDPVPGAEGYRIRFAVGAAVGADASAIDVPGARASFVHHGLTDGSEYHYTVSAVVAGAEASSSNEAVATPAGEWVLEELGSGLFEDVASGGILPRVPVEQRVHLLVFAEGYTAEDMTGLHDLADHDGNRSSDVDEWVDYIFSIDPYSLFREAFVVWYLPRVSATRSGGGDTAFAVPVSGGAVSGISSMGETATRVWQAVALHPLPPTDFSGGGFGTVRTHVAAFLVADPEDGRAGLSGVTLSLRNPDDGQQRISTGLAMGHAHEFTHAFAGVRDEYLEDDNDPPGGNDELSNVVASPVCSELPWGHLLAGGEFNASTTELVGAFGRATHGFHSELLCLMNGTHDNATYYGGNGLLRVDDRLCNYCRELTTFQIYARSSVLPTGQDGFDQWKDEYRTAYYERHPMNVPSPIPQTNNVRNPEDGMSHYEACTESATVAAQRTSTPAAGDTRSGCLIGEP